MLLAALCCLSALTPSPPADASTRVAAAADVPELVAVTPMAEGEGQPGFVERYFPLQMNEPLDAQVQDLRLLFFLGGLLPAGQVWVPLIGGLEVDDDYFLDALLIAAVHLFPHLAIFILVAATPFAIIPVFGWILVGSIYVINALNLILFLVNNFYFTPVAIVNEADRHALGGGSKRPQKRRKKKRSRAPREAQWVLPASLTTASNALAY